MSSQRIVFSLLAATVLSVSLTPFAAADDSKKPHAVIVVGTMHYSPELTMPVFARELQRFGFRTTVVMGEGNPEKKTEDVLPGIEALADADLAIFFMRFLKLPDNEWQPIEDYLKSGKPVIDFAQRITRSSIPKITRGSSGMMASAAERWARLTSCTRAAKRKSVWSTMLLSIRS